MNDLALAIKVCSACGEEKPLSLFYQNKNYRDGRSYACATCTLERVKQSREGARERLGIDEFRRRNREAVRRCREGGGAASDKAQKRAYRKAWRQLRDVHRSEFDRFYQAARYEEGLL